MKRFKQRVAALAATTLLSAGMLALPQATAQPDNQNTSTPEQKQQACTTTHRTAVGGTLQWGVLGRWLDYITGRIAQGAVSGSAWKGSTFQFTPHKEGTNASGSTGTIKFDGDMKFTGHAGALDMTFTDITLNINGSSAQLLVDYDSTDPHNREKGKITPHFKGNDVPLVDIRLNQPANFSNSTINLSGNTTLTSKGSDIFGGVYESGMAFAPISGSVSIEDACGEAPNLSGGSGSGTATGPFADATNKLSSFNDLLDQINRLFNLVDSLVGGVLKFDQTIRNAIASHAASTASTPATTTGASNTVRPPAPAGSPASPSGNPAGGTSGGGATPSAPGKAPAAAPSGTVRAATPSAGNSAPAGSAPTTNASVCTEADSLGVTSASAQWGVRQSFRTYISGSIAKGKWELANVQDNGQTFLFNGNAGAVNPSAKAGSILFPGTIRFTGHGGILDTRLSNMEIQFSGNTGQLLMNVNSNSVEGEPHEYGRIVLANLTFSDLSISGNAASGTATTALTAVGAEAFGSFYPEGDPLDPISFTAQLGGSSNCASGQGNTASAQATGTGNAGAAAALRSGGGTSGGASTSASTGGTSGTSVGGAASGAAGTSAAGGVFDELTPTSADSASSAPKGDQFSIKSTGAEQPSGFNDARTAGLIGLAAAFLVAGGAVSSFVRRNPTAR